jgi:HlyD family secretion protein
MRLTRWFKPKWILRGLLPAALLAGGAWWGIRSLRGAPAAAARFETVRRGDVEVLVTETGTIEPLKKVEVKSKVAGRVARLLVDEGSRIRAGQLLAEIDPTEINSQVEQIRAQVDAARARYDQACRAVLLQKDQTRTAIAQSEQSLLAAEARLKVALEENRAQPGRTGSALAQAQASLASARNNLSLLRDSTQPQAVVQARTAYDEARAASDAARRNLERDRRLRARGLVAAETVDARETELAAATARREQARKRLQVLEEHQRLELANAQSQVAEAAATLERARADETAIPIKEQEVLAARAAVAQASAALEAARAERQQAAMREDEVAAARASVAQVENQLQEVQVRQGDTRLLAPVEGTVTRRYIEEGELITSGVSTFSSGTPVLQIADLSRMLVKLSVNEVDVHQVRRDLPVEIRVDGARGEVFHGRVYKVAPAAAAAGAGAGGDGQGANGGGGGGGGSGGGSVIRFAVEVLVDRPDPRLKPGMSARCTIVIARRQGILRLPIGCVEGDGPAATVQLLTRGMKAGRPVDLPEPRRVRLGLRGDSHVEILEGLREGERVKPGVFRGPKRKALDFNFD